MEVHCDEGVANHIGPEPCVSVPRDRARSVGRGLCRPAIEPRKLRSECRRRLAIGRQHDQLRQREQEIDSAWSKDPGMHRRFLYGNREVSGSAACACTGPHREGAEP